MGWIRSGLALGLCLTMAAPLAAQEWITPEACRVTRSDADNANLPADIAPQVDAEAAAMAYGTGRFWKITSPEGRVSYIWASFHSSDPLILDLPSQLVELVRNARVLVLEADPRAANRQELEERSLQAGMWLAPQDAPWDKPWLKGPLRDWIKARITAIFHDEATFGALTDAGLAAYLLSDPCEDFAAGVLPVQDQRLLLYAHEAGVKVQGLEPWDAFLADVGQPDQRETAQAIALLQASSLNPDGFSAARRSGFRLYREGRLGAMMIWDRIYLQGIFGKDEADRLSKLARGYMIGDRNRRFLKAMRRPLDAGNAVIAVGAFHLPGVDGLLSGLAALGYRVERVPVAGEAP